MTDEPETETAPPEPAPVERPVLRIIRGGEPADEELAALVAVVSARGGGDADEPEPLRRPLPPWVASGLIKGTRTKA